MEKLIELNTDSNITISRNLANIKSPEYIYIPILPNNKIGATIGKKVKIGTPLLSNKDSIITSPISGEITNIKKVSTIKGIMDALEIKNDYKETNAKESKLKRNILSIKKEVLDKALALFKIDLTNKKNLILNCIDDEPYVLTESFYLFLEYPNFLEVLDKLAEIYKLNIAIAVKASNNFSINELMNYLGMYPSLKLEIVPNLYLIGYEKFLINYLNLKEEETKVIKASSFYHLSNFLKKGRLKSDKLITISGNNIQNPFVARIKIGTPLNIILKEVQRKDKNSLYIANGLMSGKEITSKDFIITEDISSVLIINQKTIPKEKEGKCLNCGACSDICPVNINPLLLENSKYKDRSKCLKCGLCSYICPVYIKFNYNEIKGDRNE